MEDSLKINVSNENTNRDFIFIYRFGSNPSTEIIEVEEECNNENLSIPPGHGSERIGIPQECSESYIDPFTGEKLNPNLNTEFTDPLTGKPLDDLTVNITNEPVPNEINNFPITDLPDELANNLFPGFSSNNDALTTTKNLLSLVPDGINITSSATLGTRFAFGINAVTRNVGILPDYLTAGSDPVAASFYMIGQTNNIWLHINNKTNPSTLFSNFNR